jgi:uncharacterized cupin superfamily protein
MPIIFKNEDLKFSNVERPVPEFSWHTSQNFSEISKSKHLRFDIRSLDPGKYSFPYHFHRAAEELFYIISGQATLRTPDGFSKIKKGDLIFFEEGETSAHQLYNHSEDACVYLDILTTPEIDVCEYPDSGKINILPNVGVFEKSSRVQYFKGEEDVANKWPDHID